MRPRITQRLVVVGLVLATLVGGAVLATADEQPPVGVVETDMRASSGDTDMVAHGTAWIAERPPKFKRFITYGWGTLTRRMSRGNEWVHAPIPFISRLEGDRTFVSYVEFCAISTNGAKSKPIRIDVWDNTVRIASQAVTWAANNNVQCHGVTISPAVMAQSLGISVQVHYQNGIHDVTLLKAWARASS
jgi:hypothetical protein